MTLNSALARSIKGFSPLSFIAFWCYCALPNFPNLIKFSVLRQLLSGVGFADKIGALIWRGNGE